MSWSPMFTHHGAGGDSSHSDGLRPIPAPMSALTGGLRTASVIEEAALMSASWPSFRAGLRSIVNSAPVLESASTELQVGFDDELGTRLVMAWTMAAILLLSRLSGK